MTPKRICSPTIVRTYAGANHSIEVPDDWQTSLDYLKQVTQAIVDYAG